MTDLLDGTYCPVPRAGISVVDIGEESVLVDGWDWALVVNPTGALIWELLDGKTSVPELAASLAEHLGADPVEVTRDVAHFVERLGADGFLDGYVPPPSDHGPSIVLVRHEIIGPGSVLADLEGVDGIDNPVSMLPVGDRQRLVVKWNPNCGYCAATARSLDDLHSPLSAAGIDLLLLCAGDVPSNRSAMQAAVQTTGVDLPSMFVPAEQDPFVGIGTPSAYLIDGDATVVSTAFGADELPELAARLAGVTLDVSADAAGRTVRYLRRRGGLCAPDMITAPGRWASTRVYRIGEFHVGVRVDSEATGTVLDRVLPGARVDDDRAGFAYMVALPGSTDSALGPTGFEGPVPSDRNDGGQPVPYLGHATAATAGVRALNVFVATGAAATLRSRNPQRVVKALLAQIEDEIIDQNLPPTWARVMARAVVVDGEALMFPYSIEGFGPRIQAVLARRGAAMVDMQRPVVDLATGTLIIEPPSVAHDPTALRALGDGVAQSALEQPPVAPGRYPLRAWSTVRVGPDGATPLTPAEAAAATVSFIVDTDDPAARVRQLGEMFATGRPRGFGLWYHSAASFFAAIDEALSWQPGPKGY